MKIIAILTIISALICMALMFRVKRENKVAILFFGAMVFNIVRLPGGLPYVNTLLCVCFIISELGNIGRLFKTTKRTLIWKLFLLTILMAAITIINSPHLRTASSIREFVQMELLVKYFALLYGFWAIREQKAYRPILKATFVGIIILTAFGILNYITKTADFVAVMTQGQSNQVFENDLGGQRFTFADRFRVQSMFSNPFCYGYICILTLFLHIYGYSTKMENRRVFIIVAICSIFGIVSCGCRTVLFCTIASIGVYLLTAYKPKRTLKVCTYAILVSLALYVSFPAVQEKTETMMSMFDKNSKYEGSSIEMRTLQYAAVFNHIQGSPLFGCGYNYFNIDMGWGEGGKKTLVDSDLWGLEGVVMGMLLERGIVGLTLYLLFYIALIVYCWRNKNYSKQIIALGLSLLTSYLLFANMTGELSSVFPTLLLLGSVVGVTETIRNTPPI